jgi:hypothetical protein
VITVMPEGGLCNRMRVIASAWLVAKAAGQPMRVLWYRTSDFNARFDALFDTTGLPFRVIERRAMSRLVLALAHTRTWWARLSGAVVLGVRDTEPGSFDLAQTLARLRRRDVLIRSNSRLAFHRDMFDVFKPIGETARRVALMRERLAHSVGVHVRRTDNAKAREVSTLERFIALMRDEQHRAPDAEFFVATDEPAALQGLRQAFGDRIWEHPKRAYARDDPAALADALVDLYALAGCRKLIGSYWSSFTDTAAELRGIELIIAREAA